MKLPLARSPGTVVTIDDSATLLQSLIWHMPESWNVKGFADQTEFLEWMKQRMQYRKAMNDVLLGGASLVKESGNVLNEVVRFWTAFQDRYEIPSVVLFDYHMPKGNGLALLDKCTDFHGGRVLLSAVADDKTVNSAFNEGKIDRFVAKAGNRMKDELVPAILSQFDKAALHDSLAWTPWLASLSAEQLMLLEHPAVVTKLQEYVGTEREYVALGRPFGVLSLPSDVSEMHWLQFETPDTLAAAAKLAGECGASKDQVKDIQAGKAISDARAIKDLCPGTKITVKPVEWTIDLTSHHTMLMGAEFSVNAPMAPYPQMRYKGWLQRQPRPE